MSEARVPTAGSAGRLLQTKLAAPSLHGALVARPELLARLDAGLERRLTVVLAPAGCGKTTLVAQWLAARRHPAAWVLLDAGDNDPVRFWRYVVTASRAFDPHLGRRGLARLQTAQQPALEEVLDGFLNELAGLAGQAVLVLEDYHLVTSPEISSQMAFFIDHLPRTLHPVLLARDEPDLPLTRWRARNDLGELTAADLRFTTEETRAFFEQALGVSMTPETLQALGEHVEGWAAGLRLAALALEGKATPAEANHYLASFSGGDRQVSAYLSGEVLAAQPEPVRQFVEATCLLDRLTPELCDAVTGRAGSARLLVALERTNLFLMPLASADGRAWCRYHSLLSEAMRHEARRLSPAAVTAFYERASTWFESQNLLDDAVESALQAQAFERAAALVERATEPDAFSELHTLRRWAALLPRAILAGHPDLCFKYALAITFVGDRHAPATGAAVEALLDLAEAAWPSSQAAARKGEVAALRSAVAFWQGRQARAFALARESLALLPENRPFWRSMSLSTASREELLAGRIAAAEHTALEAYALAQVAQNLRVALVSLEMRGEIAYAQADLSQARLHYEHVLERALGGEEMLDDQGLASLGLASVAYERDDLVTAREQALRSGRLAAQRHDEEGQVGVGLLLARIDQAQRQGGADVLAPLVAGASRPHLLRRLRLWQARFAIAAGNLSVAETWRAGLASEASGSAAAGAGSETPVPAAALAGAAAGMAYSEQEEQALTLARLHLAAGAPQAALDLLVPRAADAQMHGRTRSRIESLCLAALAHDAQGRTDEAVEALTQALGLAQPGGLRRIFLDEGQPMLALLRSTAPRIARRGLAAYAAGLLREAAGQGVRPAAVAVTPPLIEPLSPQELRVLGLLAAGLPNQEIARRLVVSINTIKSQVRSIYRKLDVDNRDEARTVARELGLLQR